MSHFLDFSQWSLNEDTKYTIDSRPGYTYKIGPNSKFWQYQKDGTTTWSWVENESSVNALNTKYNKSLAAYKPDTYEKFTIAGRESFHYRISEDRTYWEYKKIGTTEWFGVENQSSVNSLNSKYGRNLKVYSEYILIEPGWEDRAKAAANYLYINGKSIGMTKIIAAAFIGNFKQESGVRHNASQYNSKGVTLGFAFKPTTLAQAAKTPGWAGYGLAHWTQTRRQALIDAGANTINKQLDFVISELQNAESAAWSNIKTATAKHSTYDKKIAAATEAIVTKYERAGAAALATRTANAKLVYDMINQ